MTIGKLVELTNTPRTTVNRIISALLSSDLICPVGSEESTGGRRPLLYTVNPKGLYTIGIDLSRSHVHLLLCKAQFEPQWTEHIPITRKSSPHILLERISHTLLETIQTHRIPPERLIGLGIGSVGPLDIEQGILLDTANFPAPGWKHIPLKAFFEEKLQLPVLVRSGASMAVVGESIRGTGRDLENLVYVNIGMGIRCGVMVNKSLLQPKGDTEGAYGHMVVEAAGRPCYCGGFGCIESYASIPAILNQFQKELKKGKQSTISSIGSEEGPEIQDICFAAEEGDPLAAYIIQDAAVYMGIYLANIVSTLHPQEVIIGGALPEMSPLFHTRAVETARQKLYPPMQANVHFTKSPLGRDVIALGAAALVLSQNIQGRI
ncbi:MAG: ROK family protein [Clostridia bacterium]